MPNPSLDQLVAETLTAMRAGAQLWIPDNVKEPAYLGTRSKKDRGVDRAVAGAMVDYGFVAPVSQAPAGFRVYQRKKGS